MDETDPGQESIPKGYERRYAGTVLLCAGFFLGLYFWSAQRGLWLFETPRVVGIWFAMWLTFGAAAGVIFNRFVRGTAVGLLIGLIGFLWGFA